MKIYSIDLKLDDNNYSSFSGWFISDKQITNKQITSLISTIQEFSKIHYIFFCNNNQVFLHKLD